MTEADHAALLQLVAAGGASAPRRRLLESQPSPAAALAAGPPSSGVHGRRYSAAGLGDTTADRAHPPAGCAAFRHLIGCTTRTIRRGGGPSQPWAVVDGDELLCHPAWPWSQPPRPRRRDNARAFGHLCRLWLAVTRPGGGRRAAAHAGACPHRGCVAVLVVASTSPTRCEPRLHEHRRRGPVSEHPPCNRAAPNSSGPNRSSAAWRWPRGESAAARSVALIRRRLSGTGAVCLRGPLVHNPMARVCHL